MHMWGGKGTEAGICGGGSGVMQESVEKGEHKLVFETMFTFGHS